MTVRTFLRNGARILLLGVVATCTDQRNTTAPHATAPLQITPQVLPVIAPTLLTAGNDLTNTTTYTTGSISPSPNTLVLVAVMGIRTFGASPSPTVTGGGMSTWTEVASVVFDSITGTGTPIIQQRRMTVYRAMSATPGSGPITITFASNQSNAQWIVLQWDGVETSGVNGAGAIGQTGSNRADLVNGLTVALAPFANSGNVAFGVFGAASGVHGLPMITPGPGFTELNEQVSQEATPSDLQAQWGTNLNTVSAIWNSLNAGALAIEIKVATLAVASVTVDPATANVNVGATQQLTATPKDANGDPLTGRVVTWNTSDGAVATVSPTGLVTGVAGGSVTITATSEGQSGSAAVTVTVPVHTVLVEPASGTVQEGATLQLTATPKDVDGNPLPGRTVTWERTPPFIATVDANGLVTGVTEGVVEITATSEGKTGTSAVTVTRPPVATVDVSPATGSVLVGATLQLTATPRAANGTPLTGRVPVSWSSSNPAIATVTDGLVTGVAAGTVTIAATSEGVVGTASVSVSAGFSQTLLTFGTNPTNGRVYTTASIAPAPNALVTVAVLQYSSQGTPPNPTLSGGGMQAWDVVATVVFDPGVGGFPFQRLTIFRAMSATPGSGPITITAPTVALSHAHWSVSQWTGVATSGVNGAGAIRQTGAQAGVGVNGLTIPLTPFASPSNVAYGAFGVQMRAADVTPGAGFTEISDQPSGENTPGDLQTEWGTNLSNVSATWPAFNAGGLAIEINASSTPGPGPGPEPVASVLVTPNPGNVNVGATLQLGATLKDANGNTLTGRTVTWASSDLSRATVTSAGLVTGVGVGPVTITAMSEGQSGTATVNVALAPVATVVVNPGTATLGVGGSVPLTATLKDANGNTLTGRTVVWTGTNAFASVSPAGVVTGLAVGSATITATSEGQSGTATVNVTLVPVATVTVTPNPAGVNVGATVPLTATLKDANGNTLTGRTVVWTGGNAFASVSTTGVVTGLAVGSATITATSEGQSGTATVNVTLATVATVTVAPGSASLNLGSNRQFTATLRDANGNVVTGPVVSWSGSNGSVSVTADGLVWGLSPGPATITATADGTVGTASVTVTDFALMVGAGDISQCGSSKNGDEATALLLDGYPGDPVFTAGDNAYPDGTAADFANCYDPTWGRHKARTHPAAGNHDYHVDGAPAYYNYFGANAGPAGLGYYSFDIGEWHVVVLNSGGEGGAPSLSASSAQMQWLRADLAASQKQCQVAIWHHPLFSNDDSRPQVNNNIRPLWDTLWVAGVDLVLNGHDHHYVRYAPQTPKGGPDPTGIRQITVGTGGNSSLYTFSTPRSNVEVRNNVTHGVLELKLRNGSYDWRFVPVAGQVFTDGGTGNCVGPRPPLVNQLPTARPGGPYSSEATVTFNGSTSSDADGDNPLTYAWNFGDGTIGTGAQPTHTYGTSGVYTATLVVTDALGGASAPATTTVTIANVAPTVNAGPDAAVGLGQQFNLLAAISDPGLTDGPWTYVINWGDGTSNTTGSAVSQGASVISASHVYTVAGQYSAVVTVTDKDGGIGSDAVTVFVTDLPPSTIVHTLLTAGNNPANTSTYSTAAFAPGSNALITVTVLEYTTLGTPPVPTLSGGGMTTWDVVRTVTFDGTKRRLTIFRAMSAQPGNGALTITTGMTLSNMQWIVSQWDGVDMSGVNGAGAVVQAGSTSGTGVNGLTVPLSAFGHPNNVSFGAFGVVKNIIAVTPGAGFTEITEIPSAESSPGDLQAQRGTNLPAISATWTSLAGGAIGIEIKVRP